MAYVYSHTRLDKNEIFYIGIGSDKDGKYLRAFSKKGRNALWKLVNNKTNTTIQIIFDNISWEESKQKEIELIKLYGRKNLNLGSLCNLTDGGDGSVGGIVTNETREKIRNTLTGRKNEPCSQERKDKISKANLGKKRTVLERIKFSLVKKGKPAHNKGIPASEKTKERLKFYNDLRTLNKGKNVCIGDILLDINTGVFYNSIKEFCKINNIRVDRFCRNIYGKNKINQFSNIIKV